MKSALRFCWAEVSLAERKGESVTGCGELRVGGLQAAGIVVEKVERQCHQTDRLMLNDTV